FPDSIVEAQLAFLLDVAGELVRRDPARVYIECRLTLIGVGVDNLQLHRVPGRTVRRPRQAALARGADARQPPRWTESKVDQLDVVDGNVGARVTPGNPLRELAAADLFGLEQGRVAVVDVPEHAVRHMRP